MENFLKEFDKYFCKFWNALYELLCEYTGAEVDERWYIKTILF